MVGNLSANEITSQLHRVAGVRMSSTWLSACLAHLRETRQAETADAVLLQVLYSDLRDVVERNNDDGILRQALSQNHATLPSTFTLMVQVEELLDVSLNAEARLQVGPASISAPTPVGNQRTRCLKLYLSDGYSSQRHLVAMEVTPLKDLSVNSKAGIKMVLRGPLTCRHGLVLCHPATAQVLGGSVASLVEIQRKALEQAKKAAGVGVDPTVKALIWNPEGADEQGEQDEREGESGDVQAGQPAVRAAPPPPPSQRAQPTTTSSHNVPPTRPPPTRTNRLTPPVQSSVAPPTSSCPPPRRQEQQPPRSTGANPYATSRNASRNTMMASRPPVPSTNNAANGLVDLSRDEPMAEPMDLVTPTNTTAPTPTPSVINVPNAPPSQDVSSFSQETRGSFSSLDTEQTLSFTQLKELVARVQADHTAYRQYENKTFAVTCQMIGHHQYFNIEKKKKKKRDRKNKDDKYEYSYGMNVNMGGTDSSQGIILCSVSSDILTTFFEMPACDMRDLQKTEPAKCQEIVQERGLKIKRSLVVLASTKFRLLQPAADGTTQDGPLLELIRRE